MFLVVMAGQLNKLLERLLDRREIPIKMIVLVILVVLKMSQKAVHKSMKVEIE